VDPTKIKLKKPTGTRKENLLGFNLFFQTGLDSGLIL
jgi:hypothetical protein